MRGEERRRARRSRSRSLGGLGNGQLAAGQAEHLVVKEGERFPGLVESGERLLFCLSEVFEEVRDGGQVEVARVLFVVEKDK